MQFMMHPLTTAKDFEKHEPAFRDISQYLASMEPPKYPFAIDKDKAAKGETVFKSNCAKCHGAVDWKPLHADVVVRDARDPPHAA